MTMAPLVAKDKLIVGDCGGEMGVRGRAAALDQATGKVIWKAYSTSHDNEVLIGADFKPFYSQYKGKDLGVSTYGRLVQSRRCQDGRSSLAVQNISGIIWQPTTWRGPDNKQYVSVLSGVGGWAGAIVACDLDKRDGTAALGFVNAMKDLPDATTKGGTLNVFALP